VLAHASPALIVSSDLRRACQTAEALATRVSLPVEIDPRLRERSYGDWEGLTAAEIARRYPAEDEEWRREGHVEVRGVEPLPHLAARVAAALRDAAERGSGRTVVAVTHGSAGRHGCRELLGLPLDLSHVLGGLANCRWTELRPQPKGWQLVEHNVGAPLPVSDDVLDPAAE
jgi:probable phosphoglycerate mutase